MPSVSVIIPVYNYAQYVATAIESALAQTHRDAQIIVVDDGSTDDTASVLARFGARIEVYRQANRGLAAARNTAIRAARGEYIALLDADDVWEPQFLELSIATITAAGASTVGAFTGWVMIDRDGRILPNTQMIRRGAFGVCDLLYRTPFHPSTVTLRRRPVSEAGGFDEALAAVEDWDLWLRLTAGGGSFIAVEHALCRYRVHGQNMSFNPDTMQVGALRTLEKLYASDSLPTALRAERQASYAHVYARASSQLYAAGRGEEAARALGDAVRAWPDILFQDETHWAIICAEQPVGYKGSPHHLDLERAERRILSALAACAEQTAPRMQGRARGRAYRALAQLAYAQERTADARRFVARAIASDPVLWSDPAMAALAARALVGKRLVDRLRRRKR